MTARVVDAVGTFCPVPVRRLARAVAAVGPGDRVELLADDPLVEVDVPAWCHAAGVAVESLRRDPEGVYRITVRAAGRPPGNTPTRP